MYAAALLPFYSCSDEDEDIEPDYYLTEPLCKDTFTPKPYTYSVVGFYPSWKHDVLPISSIKWDKITRVVYAFASQNLDGSLNVSYLTKMDELVSAVHAQGVEVYFSGWWTGSGPHSSYEDAIGSGSDEGSTGLAYWVNYRGCPRR
ncbi:MAG: hypothetical protein GH151_10470 [Bacteroidetes bacterium]|nr:hypothetical protein [Bacteroidota bacterium]